jgi:hypothetical protein
MVIKPGKCPIRLDEVYQFRDTVFRSALDRSVVKYTCTYLLDSGPYDSYIGEIQHGLCIPILTRPAHRILG